MYFQEIELTVPWIADLSEQVKSPSPIVRIDDVDIDDWLMTLPNYFQDPDAQYNGALFNPGNFVLGGVSNGQASYQNEFVFHNDSTKYSFANGTSRTVPNKAFSQIPIDARSGLELFERYLIPSNSAQTQSSPSGNPGPPSASATSGAFENYTDVGFPVPLVGTSDGALSGYFLDSAPNTAVLSIQTFEPSVSPVDVSNAVKSFLAKARAGNKSRLVIDIRGNPGGNVFLGFDVFKQLFPGVTPYSATRFRAHPGSEAIGLVASQDGPPQSTFVDVRDKNLQISQFNYHDFLKSPDGASFASFDEYFGPFEANGDNFSSTASWEFSNQALDILSDNIVVSGYANETELPPQPFPASNIVVVSSPILIS